jgi:hypothetical protein
MIAGVKTRFGFTKSCWQFSCRPTVDNAGRPSLNPEGATVLCNIGVASKPRLRIPATCGGSRTSGPSSTSRRRAVAPESDQGNNGEWLEGRPQGRSGVECDGGTGCCGNIRDDGGSDGSRATATMTNENLDKTISELAQEGYEIKAAEGLSALIYLNLFCRKAKSMIICQTNFSIGQENCFQLRSRRR